MIGRARILLLEDRELAGLGLRGILEHEPDLEVVGAVSSGPESLEFTAHVQPDLIVMSVQRSAADGLAATRVLKERRPDLPIVWLSSVLDPASLVAALGAGVDGLAERDGSRVELLTVLRHAVRGEATVSSRLARGLIDGLAADPREPRHPEALSPRELAVLSLAGASGTAWSMASLGALVRTGWSRLRAFAAATSADRQHWRGDSRPPADHRRAA